MNTSIKDILHILLRLVTLVRQSFQNQDDRIEHLQKRVEKLEKEAE